MLAERGETVRALILPGDKLEKILPDSAQIFHGDVTDTESMLDFFTLPEGCDAFVVHCAGIVTLIESFSQAVYDVNVGGTRNVIDLCARNHVKKLVYISSASAIPLLPKGQTMREVDRFDADLVQGCYAKTKAEATQLVLDAAAGGLDASVVHPTGIFGVRCFGASDMITMVTNIYKGKMRFASPGGTDFVDVRDLAEAIISCCHNGRRGECYIVGGTYYTIKDLFHYVKKVSGRGKLLFVAPVWLVSLFAPVSEWFSKLLKYKTNYTRFSIGQLIWNADYSKEKAKKELQLKNRPFEETMRDTLDFLRAEGRI